MEDFCTVLSRRSAVMMISSSCAPDAPATVSAAVSAFAARPAPVNAPSAQVTDTQCTECFITPPVFSSPFLPRFSSRARTRRPEFLGQRFGAWKRIFRYFDILIKISIFLQHPIKLR
jgi:hypothetical protein